MVFLFNLETVRSMGNLPASCNALLFPTIHHFDFKKKKNSFVSNLPTMIGVSISLIITYVPENRNGKHYKKQTVMVEESGITALCLPCTALMAGISPELAITLWRRCELISCMISSHYLNSNYHSREIVDSSEQKKTCILDTIYFLKT